MSKGTQCAGNWELFKAPLWWVFALPGTHCGEHEENNKEPER